MWASSARADAAHALLRCCARAGSMRPALGPDEELSTAVGSEFCVKRHVQLESKPVFQVQLFVSCAEIEHNILASKGQTANANSMMLFSQVLYESWVLDNALARTDSPLWC